MFTTLFNRKTKTHEKTRSTFKPSLESMEARESEGRCLHV
jgi:hypothetical protein